MKKYVFILSFIFLMLSNCYTITLSDIRNDIRIQIKDNSSDTSNRRYSDSVLNARINLVQDEITEQTRCLITRITTHTVAEQREYRYPSNMLAPIRLAYAINVTSYTVYSSTGISYKRLSYNTIGNLDRGLSSWENTGSGLPTDYYERGQYYGLKPKPSTVYSSTFSVQIDYYMTASTMSADTDVPFNGDVTLSAYHKLLIMGVVIMCRRDMGIPIQDIEQLYYALLSKMKDSVRTRIDERDQLIIAPR